MKVKFVKTFFGPNGVRYKAGRWHSLPDGWTLPQRKNRETGKLEPDCQIDAAVDTAPAPVKPPPPPQVKNGSVTSRAV